MNEQELYPDSSRSLDSLRYMRLMALMRDMIEADGKVKTAAALGVNYRTLARAEESGRLTARMENALERHLLLLGGSAAAQQRKRVDTLAERVASLETELRDGLEATGRCEAAGEERMKAIRQLERRLSRLEAAKSVEVASEVPPPSVTEPAVEALWRDYRDLVTENAEPGEERVYGDATQVIVEWRKARMEYREALATGTALDRADASIRVLEIEMIDRYELTLPPRTYPWDRSDRRDQVWDRRQSLEDARVERNRALLWGWLRRVLTLGLWRR